MAKIISTIKAILTRLIFSAHSLIAIWQVTENKGHIIYWSLCGPLALLLLEGIFTLAIKKNQEWRWFCPSVFLYLGSIVPAIWLLELDKVDRRNAGKNNVPTNHSLDSSPLGTIDDILGNTGIDMPSINVDTWTTLIEQFLMLILIVGRWLLPKGDLTRDQLSQLLLVYIGTAADIIEFFDSYKDDSIAKIPLLVYLTLGIWSWSLLQFTIVLSATRARRSRGGGPRDNENHDCCNNCCCGIDIWGIVLNVILQDAPFLTFRLLIIFQYKIINYMNVFFTCKNSLVIVLQLYRLYVVNSEFWKARKASKALRKSQINKARRRASGDLTDVYVISERGTESRRRPKRPKNYSDDEYVRKKKQKRENKYRTRKDTGYSTASSQNLHSTRIVDEKSATRRKDKKPIKKAKRDPSTSPSEAEIKMKRLKKKPDKADHKVDKKNGTKKNKIFEAVTEESSSSTTSPSSWASNSTLPSYEVIRDKKSKKRRRRSSTSSTTSSNSSGSSSSSSS
ncbi:transmembrane protein 26 [Episyrphus balteatus]|uniref:transmembrane protein 26 n=1 Tax=Episyrphus balteatus TaxID=286459 RepID=UPI002485896E|nr:transmembrane protein 26 [Episyrphus balteatus]